MAEDAWMKRLTPAFLDACIMHSVPVTLMAHILGSWNGRRDQKSTSAAQCMTQSTGGILRNAEESSEGDVIEAVMVRMWC